MPRVTFLTASDGMPLTKRITKQGNEVNITNYPKTYLFDSHEIEFDSLRDFYTSFTDFSSGGACMLIGNVTDGPLEGESRAGRVSAQQMISLIVFDIDGVDDVTIDQALLALDATNTTHIRQYSASSGLPGKEGQLRCHLIFLAKNPIQPENFRDWLLYKNFSQPIFANNLSLTKSNLALHYPLDTVTYQPSRLIYIAPPEFTGMEDPHGSKRTELVVGKKEHLNIQFNRMPNIRQIKNWRADAITELRAEAHLPAIEMRMSKRAGYDGHTHDVLLAPGHVSVTGMKQERGFTYLNINGGDSWGYFHPDLDPKLIYNFKGEEVLATEKVNPTYYRQAKARANAARAAARREERQAEIDMQQQEAYEMLAPLANQLDEPRAFYFIDEYGKYRVGKYDGATRELTLRSCTSRPQVTDFAAQHNLPDPEFIPHVKVKFDPTSLTVFTPGENDIGELNIYSPSLYRIQSRPLTSAAIPRNIHALLTHVMGHNQAMVEHYLNWLSFIMQTGKKPQTAWLLSGTTGTGKGTLLHQVLIPLFGHKQVMSRRLDQLEDAFDGELIHTQLLWIDEVSVGKLRNPQRLFDKINNLTTEEKVPIRKLFTEHAVYDSYLAVMAATNSFQGIRIDQNDRRWNVPTRQETPLNEVMQVGPPLHQQLHAELQDFMNFLMGYAYDEDMVRTPMFTQAKQDLQKITLDAPTEVAIAVREGDLDYFIDLLPDINSRQEVKALKEQSPKFNDMVNVILRIAGEVAHGKAEVVLTRSDLLGLFGGLIGWDYDPHSLGKFSKVLHKYGIHLHRLGAGRSLGIVSEFSINKANLEYLQRYYMGSSQLKTVK